MKLYDNFINDGTLTNFYGGKTDSGYKLQINQNKMRITIEQYEHKIIHEVPHNDVTLDEALDMIEGLLKATGYSFKGNLEIVEEWHENDEQ